MPNASVVSRRPSLYVAVIGPGHFQVGQQVLRLKNRKTAALLAYLALSDPIDHSREGILGLLWGDVPEERARASLRQALYELRASLSDLGFDGLRANRVAVSLDHEHLELDLAEVLVQCRDGLVHSELLDRQRMSDAILEGAEAVDSGFRAWLLTKRQSIHQRLIRDLEASLARAEDGRRIADAALAILNLDPTHEVAVRALMQLRADVGDIGGALGLYRKLWDLLEADYDTEPSKETQNLVAAIKLGTPHETPSSAPREPILLVHAAAPARFSETTVHASPPRSLSKLVVSVAPFDLAMATDKTHYLVQGFRRELIASLVRFREWIVRDPAIAVNSTTDEAEYVIEASALQDADTLRLVLTLRETGSDAYLWSERLKLSMTNWFHAQEVIVRRLAVALNVHLSAERTATITQRAPGDLKAYDQWLLGQATVLRFDDKSWDQAREIFLRVIDDTPSFAPAYSSLAQLNNGVHIARPGTFRNSARTAEALTFAREAVRLDPVDSRSQLALGWSHAMSKQYDQAAIYMLLASELNESDPWTMVSAANCLAFCGHAEEAKQLATRALDLPLAPSPLHWSYQTAIRFLLGDYEGCVEAAHAAGDHVNPNVPGWKCMALAHLGLHAAAADELQRFYTLTRQRWTGPGTPSNEDMTRWLLHLFPIKRPEDWMRLHDGMAIAGAPAGTLAHHQW